MERLFQGALQTVDPLELDLTGNGVQTVAGRPASTSNIPGVVLQCRPVGSRRRTACWYFAMRLEK